MYNKPSWGAFVRNQLQAAADRKRLRSTGEAADFKWNSCGHESPGGDRIHGDIDTKKMVRCISDVRDPRHLPPVVAGRAPGVRPGHGLEGGGTEEPARPHLDAHPLLHQREGQQARGQHQGQRIRTDRPGRKRLLRPQVAAGFVLPPMNLKHYPFDRQSCRIRVSSWSYDMNALVLRWHEECVTFLESVELPEHFLDKDDVICKAFNSTYETSGQFSGLVAHLRFRREIPYYLMEVYLPISLLVIGSWLSFWLDVYAVPARTALGITTILTIITSSRGIKESIPRVSYVKAVDVWIETCTWLVFCALLEFPFVNFIARRGKENDALAAQNNFRLAAASNKLFQVVRQPSATHKVSASYTNGPLIRQFGDSVGDCPADDFTPPPRSAAPCTPNSQNRMPSP
ncbi:glutamate-gated chloride channel [Caerostris extrusa]|uniref:Glutamate-gated chloride channel n=1 Tax=Caerostris extrusa TaxID=172846 RepID=A0AAV4XK92_CAEEX|nr:glutamate-gated chloride channel [Caerostris extrusa]